MKQHLSSKPSHRKPAGNFRYTRHLLLAALAAAPAASAQVATGPEPEMNRGDLQLEAQPPHKKNRVGLSARFGFNMSATFKNVPGYPTANNAGPAGGGGYDHFYDDGYVRPDETYPNSTGLTYFWGYDNASQVGANDIFFHNSPAASGTDSKVDPTDVSLGFEFTYARELQRNAHGSWGLELGAGWTYLNFNDRRTLHGQVNALTDAYSLGTPPVVAPAAPYRGSFNGPNTLIDETPNRRTTTPVAATVAGYRRLTSDVYLFRLGPYFDYRLTPQTSLQAGVGAALALVDSRFSFKETTSTALGAIPRYGETSDTAARFGPYLMGQFITEFAKRTYLFAGVQFYMLGDDSLKVGSKEVELDFKQSLFVHAGLGFSF